MARFLVFAHLKYIYIYVSKPRISKSCFAFWTQIWPRRKFFHKKNQQLNSCFLKRKATLLTLLLQWEIYCIFERYHGLVLSKPESGLAINNVDTHKKDVDVKHSRWPSAEICSRGEIVLQNVSFAGLVLRQAVSGLPLATTRQGKCGAASRGKFYRSLSRRYYAVYGTCNGNWSRDQISRG